MPISRYAASLLGVIAMTGLTGVSRAGMVALNNTDSQQSSLEADASLLFGGNQSTKDSVNALPLDNTAMPTRAAVGSSAASVRAVLSDSNFSFDLGETLQDPGSATSTADIFFTAGAKVSFAISGDINTGGEIYVAAIQASLMDTTTGTFVYQFGDSFLGSGAETVTLDTSGGPLQGALTAGDGYEFSASESLNNEGDPSANGNISIAFSPTVAETPLPPAGWAGLVLMGLLGAVQARRRTAH